MKTGSFLTMAVMGLSSVIILGGLSTVIMMQPVFGSSDEESSEEESGPQGQSGAGEDGGGDDGSESSGTEPIDEPEVEPAEQSPAPLTDTPALNNEQQEQEQVALDILTANGLTPINATSGSGTIEKCAVNSQGQTFCYEPLPTEENCLKPIKEEDPPLCSSK